MKKAIYLLFILNSFISYSQKESYFEVKLDFSAPQSKRYLYHDSNNIGYSIDINDAGILLNNFGVNLSYNYLLFKRLSFGVISGFYSDTKQKFSHFRLGGNLKYYYVKDNYHNLFIELGNNFSFDKKKFSNGVNTKIGISFPIYKADSIIYLFDLFLEQNYYNLKNSNKLIGFENEIPNTLDVDSVGFSFGIRF